MSESSATRTKIIVISMANAVERQGRFASRAAATGLPWQFVPAMTTLHAALSYAEDEAVVAKGRPLFKGEIGCYSSHYAAWESLQGEACDQYIVLEDDVIVDWAFLGKIVGIDFAAMGINYLRLYYKWPAKHTVLLTNFIEKSRSIVELSGSAYGTQGYLITKAGARILLDHCRNVKRPIDDEMDRSWAHGLPNLAIFPFPLIEESSLSTISGTRFEKFAVPARLKLRRFLTRKVERWRIRAARVTRSFRRPQIRPQA